MYLMHNKMERPVTQRLSESKREKTCGRDGVREEEKSEITIIKMNTQKSVRNMVFNAFTTFALQINVLDIFFPSLFFLQYFFLPLSLTIGILSVCLSFSLSIISVSVSPAHRTRAHLHISAVCFISFSFILVWSFICHLVARTLWLLCLTDCVFALSRVYVFRRFHIRFKFWFRSLKIRCEWYIYIYICVFFFCLFINYIHISHPPRTHLYFIYIYIDSEWKQPPIFNTHNRNAMSAVRYHRVELQSVQRAR